MSKPDSAEVRAMFGRIARRYDLANRLLSGGLDRGWRRRLVGAVKRQGARVVLDVATGSGDVAFALCRALPAGAEVVGLDFCEPMLAEAERKRRSHRPPEPIRFLPGDALNLPEGDGSCDAVTIAFGLRNLPDRARFLAEARRVLRPGGGLFILEFSQPNAWFRPVYFWYLRRVLPSLGGWIAGDRDAYRYLNLSIEAFPSKDALSAELRAAGFGAVRCTSLSAGAVALHEGR